MTWYCPKCEDEHAEDEEFVMVEQVQFCIPHAQITSLMEFVGWRYQK